MKKNNNIFKKKENEIERVKKLLEYTQQLTKIGGWEYRVKDGEIYWTEELFDLHGFPKNERSGYIEKSLECYPPAARKRVQCAFDKAVKEGKAYDLEVPFVNVKGEKMWVRTLGTPVWKAGKVIKVVGNFMDITERKNLEIKLRERIKELNLLINISHSMVNRKNNLQEILQDIVEQIPSAMQFPESTSALIQFNEQEFKSKDFKKNKYRISSQIKIAEDTVGLIEIYYDKSTGEGEEIFFLNKEKEVINTLTEYLELLIQNQEIQEELKLTQFSLEKAFFSVFRVNPEGKIIYVNSKACEMLKYTGEELLEKNLIDIITFYTSKTREKHWERIKNKGFDIFESELKTKEGEVIPVQVTSHYLVYRKQEFEFVFIQDISRRKQDEKELKDKQELLEKSQKLANVGSWKLNLKNNQLTWSKEVYRIFGVDPEEFEVSYKAFLNMIHSDDQKKVDEVYIQSLENKESGYQFEFRIINQKTGQIHYVREECEHIINESGRIFRSLGMIQDITGVKQKESELEYIAYHDQLTGIYNRRYMKEKMEELNRKDDLPLSVILIDINGLKMINDTYGHKKGDKLLIKTSKIFEESVRAKDIVGRWGGDEFVILLPQTARKEAEKIYERIKKKCVQTKKDQITVSLGRGIAVKEDSEQDFAEVLYKADCLMYQDKLTASKSIKSKLVGGLLNTLVAKSFETKEHSLRMQNLAIELGKKIGLNKSELNDLSLASILHDLGKTSISEEILKKPGDLNEQEWEEIKKHPRYGYNVASAIDEISQIAPIILAHQEKWDGSGYPDGLKGEEIPLLARIVAIIDAFDVMTNPRPYKKARSEEYAIKELKKEASSQFAPNLVEKFLTII